MDGRDEEVSRLRSCVRDLTALSALPLVWIGEDTPEVLGYFVDVLLATLRLDVAYTRVGNPEEGQTIEAACVDGQPAVTGRAEEIGRALDPTLVPSLGPSSRATVPHPLRSGMLRVAAMPLEIAGHGIVVAGSHRADFPTDADTALLGAAVNQLTIWLRASRLLVERTRAEATLAERERLQRQLEEENAHLREEIRAASSHGGIVGKSGALQEALAQLELVAPTEATVLVLGESGTGKELFAREIHAQGARADRPLIKVNCSAIPREMFESEFFGHVRGAFTSAVRDRVGRFQLADGGTIFLDEVGDLPLELQPKLLRVLQEGQYERVGDDTTREVNVRVIAATNRKLLAEVQAGRFRQDLYYRLSVFPMQVPPLRDRKEDIPLLAASFATHVARKLGIAEPRISASECEALKTYDWPGNVRELQNLVERSVILSRGGRLRLDLIFPDRTNQEMPPAAADPASSADEVVPDTEWRRRERANVEVALKRANGRVQGEGGAAELLGLRPSTLNSRLKALGISARAGR